VKLAIGIPSFSGIQNAAALLGVRRRFAYIEFQGCPILPLARNAVFSQFLDTDCTHLLSLDDDIHFQPEALEALIAADVPIVGCAYPKRIGSGFNVDMLDLLEYDGSKPIPVLGLGLGFVLIAREVLEKFRGQHVDRAFTYGGRRMWAFTDAGLYNGTYVCESYTWCRYMREQGESVFVLPNWNLNHAGKTACFTRYLGLPHSGCGICAPREYQGGSSGSDGQEHRSL